MMDAQPEKRTFVKDQRGAMMVVAVFLAVFLVGGLWYVIGIGDAILYRERMQDGADAVAFAAAVQHARGMNMIAMVNLIMAAIMAVLVALKIIQLLVVITNIVSCVLCAVPFGQFACGACVATTEFEPELAQIVDRVGTFVDATEGILSVTQTVVAKQIPHLAQAKGAEAAALYSKPVEGGTIFSASLIPQGDRLGLPVQEDDKILCKKAGMYVGYVIFSPFRVFGIDTTWAEGALGNTVSATGLSAFFCNETLIPGTNLDPGALSGSIANQACGAKKKAALDAGETFDDADMTKCKKDTKKKAKDKTKSAYKPSTAGAILSILPKTPKKVFVDAKNGDDYFQIWSMVSGDTSVATKADRGVAIPSWGKSGGGDASSGKMAVAQAEFYYDRPGSWDSLKEEAMWNMRWRARLRRVHAPTGAVAGILGGAGFTSLLSGGTGSAEMIH